MYNNYESTDPTFDCTNLKRFAGDMPCPAIDEAMLHSYIRYGEEDRWGKRRIDKPVVHWQAADYFREFPVADDVSYSKTKSRLAIDLAGPGGGQWTLGLMPDGNLVCTAGVHSDADSLLRISVTEFKKLVGNPTGSHQRDAVEQLFPLSCVSAFASHSQGTRERVF